MWYNTFCFRIKRRCVQSFKRKDPLGWNLRKKEEKIGQPNVTVKNLAAYMRWCQIERRRKRYGKRGFVRGGFEATTKKRLKN